MIFFFTYFVFLTQEVEFGRKWQSVSIRNKRVVSSILRLYVVNNQSMKPELNHREGVMCVEKATVMHTSAKGCTFQCESFWCDYWAGPPLHLWTTFLWPCHQTPHIWTSLALLPSLSDQRCPAAPPAVSLNLESTRKQHRFNKSRCEETEETKLKK